MTEYNNITTSIDFAYIQRFRWVELPNRGESVCVDLVALVGPRGQVGEKRVYIDSIVFNDAISSALDKVWNVPDRDVKNCWAAGVKLAYSQPKAFRRNSGEMSASMRGRIIGAVKIAVGREEIYRQEDDPKYGQFAKRRIDNETVGLIEKLPASLIPDLAELYQRGYIWDGKSRFIKGKEESQS